MRCTDMPSKEAQREARMKRAYTQPLIEALEAVTKELREIVKGEKCDHSVGICFCATFRALDQADEALKEATP